MANLDRSFDIGGALTAEDVKGVRKVLEGIAGVNHVRVDGQERKITVGYTPGITNVQSIKEAIESQGLDVSDQGDD